MNLPEMKALVEQCSYKPGWYIKFGGHDRPFIQVCVDACTEAALSPFTGMREAWKGGKRYLSEHMCRQEVVSAVFGAIKDAEEHEMREWFKYKGRAIFNPHIDPDALASLVAKKANLNLRENAMSMDEPPAGGAATGETMSAGDGTAPGYTRALIQQKQDTKVRDHATNYARPKRLAPAGTDWTGPPARPGPKTFLRLVPAVEEGTGDEHGL
jgi:hypothetical protein